MDDLEAIVRARLRGMPVPTKRRSFYPALHAVADDTAWPSRAEAIAMVFQVVCEAVDVQCGGEYMGNALAARLKDGTLERALRAL